MASLARALLRGLRYRCPACGRGRLKARGKFPEGCLECSHVYLRDPGDWTGAAETSLLISIVVAFAFFFATIDADWSLATRQVSTAAVGLVALALVYPRLKGLWIGLIYYWDGPVRPPAREGSPVFDDRPPPDPPQRAKPHAVSGGAFKPRVRR